MKKQRNIERLIARCESILSGNTTFTGQEWKLSKYVVSLDQQIRELEKESNVDPDLLRSFQQRAGVLREVLRNEEEPQGVFSTSIDSSVGEEGSLSHPHHPSPAASFHLPPSSTRGNQLLMKANSKRLSAMREQLFAKTAGDSDDDTSIPGLRHREKREEDNLESVVRRHEEMQEEVAKDMIEMAKSLRENSLVAKRIIHQDTELLKTTSEKAEKNIQAVDKETGRLKKHNSQCSWGIWFMLMLVFAVFIAMVVFIRIVPKPRT